MSAPTRPAPIAPPPPGAPAVDGPERRPGVAGPRSLVAAAPIPSTPSFLRRWNVILLVLVAAFAVLGSVASLVTRSASTTTADNTAPALVGIQNLYASVAEANTAATAAFLSTDATGVEDRINRNLYQDAIRRAVAQAEGVSATIGSDAEAHRALGEIAITLNTYSGRIEAARVQSLNDLDGADQELRQALALVQDDIGASVATVTERGQAELADERSTGQLVTAAAIGLGAVTLLALLRVQVELLRRTNRVLNPLLLAATALIAVAVGYLVVGPLARARALDEAAEGGYDAIATISVIQTSAFDLQSRLSLVILDGQGDDLGPRYDEVAQRIDALLTGTDSAREAAAAETVLVRWGRYEAVARRIESLVDGGQRDRAVELFQGEGLSTFNGLNTSIESALSDNRDQFLDGVDRASAAVGLTPFLTIILPVLAALATLLAIQRRLGEYR